MKLFKHVVAFVLATLALAATAVIAAAPSQALTLTAPKMTRTERSWAEAVFSLMNTERAAHGLRPYHWNLHLVASARYHNTQMAAANSLSHQLPKEAPFYDRELAFGYHWYTAGENCSVNPDVSEAGVLELQKMMYRERPPGETGHRLNILSRSFHDVGIAVLVDPTNQRVWMTEDFGAQN